MRWYRAVTCGFENNVVYKHFYRARSVIRKLITGVGPCGGSSQRIHWLKRPSGPNLQEDRVRYRLVMGMRRWQQPV